MLSRDDATHHIVTEVLPAAGCEVHAVLDEVVVCRVPLDPVGAERVVGPLDELLVILLRHVHHVGDDLDRVAIHQEGDDIRVRLGGQRGNGPVRVAADRVEELVEISRCERRSDHRAPYPVLGIVHVQHSECRNAGGRPLFGLCAEPVAEDFGVAGDVLDILVPHHRPEARAAFWCPWRLNFGVE